MKNFEVKIVQKNCMPLPLHSNTLHTGDIYALDKEDAKQWGEKYANERWGAHPDIKVIATEVKTPKP